MMKNLDITPELGRKLEELADQLGLEKSEVGTMAIRQGVEVLLSQLGSAEDGSELPENPPDPSDG